MFFGRHLVGAARLRWLVGETFVVIIGVLAALAIDQAWSDLLDRQLELEYLKSIRGAVQADFDYATNIRQKTLNLKIDAIEAVGPVVRGFAPIPDDVELFLTNVGMVAAGGIAPTMRVSRGAFEELLLTGNIRMITDLDIRNAITSYHVFQEAENRRITARLTDYPEFVLGILPSELREDFNLAAVKSFNVDRAIAAIMSDRFETLFNREHNLALFMKLRHTQALINSKTLLDELGAHIEHLN
jgi:hypothetical protein